MRPRFLSTLTVAAALTLSAFGCSRDNPMGPVGASAPMVAARSLTTGLETASRVAPLERTAPLPAGLSASATIGVAGGVLSLPAAGLTVVVPPGAVLKRTSFTVTAIPGSVIAYEFSPAGLKFTVPLVATQSLSGTQARTGGPVSAGSLSVGYFPNQDDITRVTESLNVQTNVAGQVSAFSIWHFSGYIFASGRSSE